MKTKMTPKLKLLAAFGVGVAIGIRQVRERTHRISFKKASVVITGGSRGLGLEMARLLAKEGALLSILAKNDEELVHAKRHLAEYGAVVSTYTCDVSNEDQVERTVAMILRHEGKIDVVINDAGIIQVGPLVNQSLKDFRESLAVHLWGPLYLVRSVLPHMKQGRSGRIVNISSIGGVVAVPHLLPYSTGKFALQGFSEGLTAELEKYGIKVTTVVPGLMRTGSQYNALFKGQYRKEFTWFSIVGSLPLLSISSLRAAQKIIEACRCGKPHLTITVPAKFLRLIHGLFPSWMATAARTENCLLPGPVDDPQNAHHLGKDSRSRWVPKGLTALSDAAAKRNNQL